MKLLVLLFAHILSATEMSYSPILIHLLSSNGLMSSVNQLYATPLVQIMTEAQEKTRLCIPKNSRDACEQVDLDSAERNCFRHVLEHATTLNLHKLWLQKSYSSVESNDQLYYLHMYWTNKDLKFLLSIVPCKNIALNIVLQSLKGKVLGLAEEYQDKMPKIPSYARLIMRAYKAHRLPAPPLPSLKVKWANANFFVEPRVHYLLFSDMLQRNHIDAKLLSIVKQFYLMCYRGSLKNKGVVDGLDFKLDFEGVQPAVEKHFDLCNAICNRWMAFWTLGMRIRRTMPTPTETALGPSLLESLGMEIKVMEKVAKEDDIKYALKCSCLHVNYLIACMQLALVFDLLKYQDHARCLDFILTHRELASQMISKLSSQ